MLQVKTSRKDFQKLISKIVPRPQPIQIPNLSIQEQNFSGYIALVGFNEVSRISLGGNDYCQTVELPQGKNIEITSDNFIHMHKSISAGKKMDLPSKNFILYQASMVYGSLGGPIFDLNGNLIGISFGFYEDEIKLPKEEKKANTEGSNLYFEIVVLEEKNNYKRSKNVNLAVSIEHPVIQEYFFDTSSKSLNITNRQSESLRVTRASTQALRTGSIPLTESKIYTLSPQKMQRLDVEDNKKQTAFEKKPKSKQRCNSVQKLIKKSTILAALSKSDPRKKKKNEESTRKRLMIGKNKRKSKKEK